MRVFARLLIACLGLIGVACAENSRLERPPDPETLEAANEVVREYLAAAAADDGPRLCSLRTVRDVRRLGGRSECARRLARSAFDGGREPESVERGDVEILPAETKGGSGHIVVWADAGEAVFESGHPVGGTVVLARVYEKDGRRRIGMVGEAVFAD
jgi:hypothetical protein